MFDEALSIAASRVPAGELDTGKLADAVTEAEYAIRNYCHRWQEIDGALEQLPLGLLYVWADMAVSAYYAARQWDLSLSPEQHVASIKEGDTTIQLSGAASLPAVQGAAKKHSAALNEYRRVYGGVRECR